MKFFDKWLFNRVQNGSKLIQESMKDDPVKESSNYNYSKYPMNFNTISGAKVASNKIEANGINFTLYPAVGGNIVEIKNYDMTRDRFDTVLHIISSDKDLGEELGKIITYENLRR